MAVGARSLRATTSRLSGWRSRIAFRVWRPIRPKPLMPMRVTRSSFAVGRVSSCRSFTIGSRPISETSPANCVISSRTRRAGAGKARRSISARIALGSSGRLHADAAAEHDHLGVQPIHQPGAHRADRHPGAIEDALALDVACVRGARHQLSVHLRVCREGREARRVAACQQGAPLPCDGPARSRSLRRGPAGRRRTAGRPGPP